MTPTVAFPRGNLAPEGALVKATAIDPSVVGADGVYRHRGPARVFTRERDAAAAIKSGVVRAGDVVVLCGRGPLGAGMEEVAQVTSALRHLDFGKHVVVVTDARFSGLSAGGCVGHVAPEALAGGPIGKVLDGDVIEVVIDRRSLEGRVDLVGHGARVFGAEEGARLLDSRPTRPDVRPDEALPEDTRLWAALVAAGGGAWGGCVYDADAIIGRLGGG
jgi:dihydroxyacid dehydratase/phosphogluconate dehydratase